MKKISKSLRFYFGMIIFSIIFYQCCTEEYRITGGGSLQITDSINSKSDTISNEFELYNYIDYEVVYENYNVGIITSSLALSCDVQFVNPLVQETIVLSFSNDIEYKSETILAGSNILDFDVEEIFMDNYEGTLWFRFSKEFIEMTTIPNGEYIISLSGETADGLQFQNEVSTVFNFN